MVAKNAKATPFFVTINGQVLSSELSSMDASINSIPKAAAQQITAYKSSGRRSTAFREAPSLPFLRPAETNAGRMDYLQRIL